MKPALSHFAMELDVGPGCFTISPDRCRGDRGLYEQGHGSASGEPPPPHSPAHKGYDRNSAREEAFAWSTRTMTTRRLTMSEPLVQW